MKVLCDLHHYDLYYSLQLLFEKRLGWELYRPIGMEWYNEGFWNVFPHPDTAKQYLALDHAINPPKDVHGNYLPESAVLNKNYRFEDGICYVKDSTKDKVHRAITLPKFKEMHFDILVSSIPQHISAFNNLIRKFQPKAKHIFQIGNAWSIPSGVRNLLASTSPFPYPPDLNVCFYHQEFDLEVYHYEPPTNQTSVNSYIHYMKEMNLLAQAKDLLPGWSFKTYGAGMGSHLHKNKEIAEAMRSSAWTWHIKPGGDGYGHVLHNTYAVGRPALIKVRYYHGKAGHSLLEDQVTCVDLSRHSIHGAAKILKKFSDPAHHLRLCEQAHKRFTEVVDFDAEEQQIRRFLDELR
jgi:hypothetical protein